MNAVAFHVAAASGPDLASVSSPAPAGSAHGSSEVVAPQSVSQTPSVASSFRKSDVAVFGGGQGADRSQSPSHHASAQGAEAQSGQSRSRAEALVKQLKAHLPSSPGVLLQINLADSGKHKGGVVVQLVDRTTHEVYFRMPPDEASPLIARMQGNSSGTGILVNSKA